MSKDFLDVSIECTDGADSAFDVGQVDIHRLSGVEQLGRPFSFDIDNIYKQADGMSLDSLAGAEVDIVFKRAETEVRRIHGMVCEAVDDYSTEEAYVAYKLKVVPRVWRLSLCKKTYLYMNVTVKDIISDKLGLAGLGEEGRDHAFSLGETYPSRNFVLQYEESGLDFLSRICEHWGISFFFEYADGTDKIVFTDHTAGFNRLDQDISYRRRGEQKDVFDLTATRRLIPFVYACRDYNYRTPNVDLNCSKTLDAGYAGGIIEYGGHFKTVEEGDALVKVRAEEQAATRTVYRGRSDVQRFAAGTSFGLTGHPRENPAVLITRIEHRASQSVGNVGTGDERTYTNRFEGIDRTLTYRPPRETPKPMIPGVVTALVQPDIDGEVGNLAEIDEQGRYTVRFMFDADPPPSGRTSRPIRKLQPSAGPGYGMHFPLRPGVEVLITFVNGDPDRPLKVGSVPNPLTPSPIDQKSSTKNRIQTQSGCLFEIEDGSGAA
jgi:type VI secretion system secreted protein VgrG